MVIVLLMTRLSRSEPVSGAMVIVRSPLSRRSWTIRRRDVVQPKRRRTDRVAHAGEACENLLDLRVIAQRDRDEPDPVGVRPRLLGELKDPILRKRAHRKVVVAGPAEPAQVGAPAHDLDQKSRAEFGIRRENHRRRRVHRVGRLQRRLLHDRRRASALPRHKGRNGSVLRIPHVVEGRNVEAAFGRQQTQEIGAIRGGVERPQKRRNQHLAFARRNGIGEQRERLRIHEGHGAANHDERIANRARLRPRPQSRQAHQRQDVRVVPLEGHRESQHVEVGDRGLRFDGQERRAGRELRGELRLGRQKHPLADDVGFGIEQLVDRLKAQVRHPDEIGIRKGQRHAQPAAVRFADVSNLLRQEVESAFALRPVFHGR